MAKAPTIYDVATRAGVSKSLVSLVLQGSPRVSEERRKAVLKAVRELNYTPSRLAAGLAGTRTRNIGVVIDDFTNLWFAPALAGLRDVLAAGGYSLSIADAALNAHLGQDPLDVFRALRVDGVVLAGEVPPEAIARLGIPSVVLGTRSVHPESVPVIASDEEAGGRLATEHLWQLGHRDIAFIVAPGATAEARRRGYAQAIADVGGSARTITADATTEAGARTAVDAFLSEVPAGDRPTAFVAANDRMAAGVFGALQLHGLQVPADASVVGYDDSALADYGYLSLTSVNAGNEALGRAAGRALTALIEQSGGEAASHIEPPRLIVRGSSAPPRHQ